MKGVRMKLVYIASPLRGEILSEKDYSKNIKKATEYCEKACSLGVLAFAPHGNVRTFLLQVRKMRGRKLLPDMQ